MFKQNFINIAQSFIPASCVIAITLFIVACGDPADKTQDALVNEPKGDMPIAVPEGGVTYVLTDASEIKFLGSKIISGSHEGGFKNITGKIKVVDGKIYPDGAITIDMNSIWSDNKKLTGHLKNKDFFEVETYPTSSFLITDVSKSAEEYSVTGDLTMHGITKSITFNSSIEISEENVSIAAEFDINRNDWGVDFKGAADNMINDKVILNLSLLASLE